MMHCARCSRTDLDEHREERELAQRRQRRLGLVQQVQAVRDESRPEQVQEPFAVGPVVQVAAVARLEGAQFLEVRRASEVLRVVGGAGVDLVHLPQALFEILAQPRHPPREPEEVLGAQEEAASRPLRPRQGQPVGEAPDRRQRLVALDVGAADRDHPGRGGDGFEERGLARPVLADEERDRRRELDGGHRPDRRDIEGEPAGLGTCDRPQGDRPKVDGARRARARSARSRAEVLGDQADGGTHEDEEHRRERERDQGHRDGPCSLEPPHQADADQRQRTGDEEDRQTAARCRPSARSCRASAR